MDVMHNGMKMPDPAITEMEISIVHWLTEPDRTIEHGRPAEMSMRRRVGVD
ncbi:MAG: hypothetical protein PHE83_07255 [Opitutaceae bacterium]|nr:hypothetical protein [Opitutaceae bacterium]